ncbi:uncharacterized protein LOC130895873 [Diorhabda carinulata]|uniref:uncharacterized protein LOC130895873 n=1 Tax=Diorhabda carinulata TaxID=1163345 RepID=UPI0025A18BDB|nr:uncharacterized protein LOC130895873 [Diorhabda carinulata]
MSNVRKTIVSNCEKKFLLKNLAEWTRLDGRAFDEFRKVSIVFGKDWGCCHVSLGKTRVLAQVSAEIQQPKSSRPSEGILNLNIELNPLAAPHFEAGRQSDLSVQLNRLLEKCLKDSKALDLESLCIKMNEKVWAIRVDINVLNYEGNILDCASIAALAALAHFRRPDVTCDGEEFIIHSVKQRDPIPLVIHHYPVCITYSIFNGGEYIIADPTIQEEGVADAFMSIGLNSYKELCGLHLGGKADLTPEMILTTANKAARRAGQIVQQIKETVEKENNERLEKQKSGCGLSLLNLTIEDNGGPGDISTVINQWATKEKKNKKKSKRKDKELKSKQKEDCPSETVEIQKCGEGTAALVPKDQKENVWTVIDSDKENSDDEIEVIEVPKPVIDLLDVNTDSEEDVVVVLNADDKTRKKKMKK